MAITEEHVSVVRGVDIEDLCSEYGLSVEKSKIYNSVNRGTVLLLDVSVVGMHVYTIEILLSEDFEIHLRSEFEDILEREFEDLYTIHNHKIVFEKFGVFCMSCNERSDGMMHKELNKRGHERIAKLYELGQIVCTQCHQ